MYTLKKAMDKYCSKMEKQGFNNPATNIRDIQEGEDIRRRGIEFCNNCKAQKEAEGWDNPEEECKECALTQSRTRIDRIYKIVKGDWSPNHP